MVDTPLKKTNKPVFRGRCLNRMKAWMIKECTYILSFYHRPTLISFDLFYYLARYLLQYRCCVEMYLESYELKLKEIQNSAGKKKKK